MKGKLIVGCSGWNYPDPAEKGGWVGPFYPDSKARFLRFYSKYFRTVEMDSTFYERFYSKMTLGTFIGIGKAAGDNFQISLKVPETITHLKRMHPDSLPAFEAFLEKIGPLKRMGKLGVILFQLPPSFTVTEFRHVESFLDRLPREYEYAVEFRHPSWHTEGPWELLNQHNVAAVMTDSPESSLQYLSNVTITADHGFIRLHGRNRGYWYNYLYSDEELTPWVQKARDVMAETMILRIYFNNHYGAKAVINALRFREMLGESLNPDEKTMLQRLKNYFSGTSLIGPS